jgi:hypothetical protein
MRKPFRQRKVSLFDSIEALVESRNAFVHAGEMDLSLYDRELKRVLGTSLKRSIAATKL